MSEWKYYKDAPKDGSDILLCLPGAQSDHYYPVRWIDDLEAKEDDLASACWQCRYHFNMTVTEEEINNCYLKPMWRYLDAPPSSLSFKS